MSFSSEYEKVEKYEKLRDEIDSLVDAKAEIEKNTKKFVEDLEFFGNKVSLKGIKLLSSEDFVKRNLLFSFHNTKVNLKKQVKDVTNQINKLIDQRIPEYKKAQKEASEFYKKYYVFTSQEIVEAFNKACSICGRRKPIVEIDTSTYIAHSKEEGPKNKRTLNDFKAETAKRHGKDYKFENDFGYGYKVYLKIYWKNRYDFLYLLPLDFNMKMADDTTLEENLTTKVINNYSEKTNYYTELQVKPSAYGKFIVPLDFTKIPTDRSESLAPIDGEVVKKVYEILTNKLRVRELVNKGELKEEIEVL